MNIVELKNITKQYPDSGKKANNNISLDLRKGEILCVAGENGAGKTTLMKILCGLEKHDGGEIFIDGNISMVHQHFMLFPEYTASENIVFGFEPRKYGVFFDVEKANKISEKIISDNNFSISANVKVKDLTLGEMQQVEICRVLYHDAQIIVLDEPTSILTEYEIKSLFNTLKTLVNNGKSIILITHKLNEIMRISDRVAVLRNGTLIGVKNVSETDEYEIAKMMMGDDKLPLSIYANGGGKKDNVLEFNNVTVKRRRQKRPLLDKVSFSVNSNEILGFAGVGGNGLGVIEAVLGGFLHPSEGKILHRGKDITKLNIRKLRNQGLSFVPADRVNVGSASWATIEENMIINMRNEYFSFNLKKLTRKNEIKKEIGSWLKKYNIDAPDLKQKVYTLSGGNLQKLILARELNLFEDYIVFSQPTWGLDIAAGRFIKGEIDALRKKGAAIILISTNLDEIIELADRIIVMYRGKIAGVFINNKNTSIKESIGNCMQGLGAAL
ncbi:ABC transporter ATP-binding protein [Treponema sp. R8-4-B8]